MAERAVLFMWREGASGTVHLVTEKCWRGWESAWSLRDALNPGTPKQVSPGVGASSH